MSWMATDSVLDGEQAHGPASRAQRKRPAASAAATVAGVAEDHHAAGLDRDAGEAGGGGALEGRRGRSPAGRRGGPGRASGALKSTPRAPARPEPGGGAGDEVEQRVGALDQLEAEADAARHHRAPGRRRPRRAPRRWPRRGRRRRGRRPRARARPRTPARRQQVGEDLVRRPHREALGLEDAGDQPQRGVVAAADARRAAAAPGAASSGRSAAGAELRPVHAAGEGDAAGSRRRAGRRRAGRASRRRRGSPGGRRASRARPRRTPPPGSGRPRPAQSSASSRGRSPRPATMASPSAASAGISPPAR